jgi:TRAP-type C4-dicarboxylate transport system permease small subunit
MLALLIAQFSETRSETGWPMLIVFLVLMLVGGIALLVHSIIDFRKDQRAIKHEEEEVEERNKRKAA